VTEATIDGLTSNTSHDIEVSGFNALGEGPKSDTVTMTTSAVSEPTDFSLLGDPNFSADNLNSTQRLWYDRMWAGINRGITNSNPEININSASISDDLYQYSRTVNDYVTALLLAFRATGDLKLLDQIDRIVQRMRSTLADGNCDGSGKNGYLNWRWRADPNWSGYCTWEHRMDSALAHAFLPEVAYAFEINRGLTSPGGVNYAERADFWKDYLVNHFEPAWRQRDNQPWPGLFMTSAGGWHPSIQFGVRYYYFMHKITGWTEYLTNVATWTNRFFNTPRVQNSEPGGYQMISTPWGDAALWSQTAPREPWVDYSGTSNQGRDSPDGQAYVYIGGSSITVPAIAAAEGIPDWSDGRIINAIGVSIAYYVMDTDDMTVSTPFARGINGENVVAHPTDGWSFDPNSFYVGRGTIASFAVRAYSLPLAFMPAGLARDRMKTISVAAYNQYTGSSDRENPRDFRIPANILIDAMRNG